VTISKPCRNANACSSQADGSALGGPDPPEGGQGGALIAADNAGNDAGASHLRDLECDGLERRTQGHVLDGHVAAIGGSELLVGVDTQRRGEAPPHPGDLAYGVRAKARAGPVERRGIRGCSEQQHVDGRQRPLPRDQRQIEHALDSPLATIPVGGEHGFGVLVALRGARLLACAGRCSLGHHGSPQLESRQRIPGGHVCSNT
jgi:hypothetical protein